MYVEPPPKSDHGPNRLDQTKWPSSLKEAVGRAKGTGRSEREHEPMTAILAGVAHEHRGDRKQAKERESIHSGTLPYCCRTQDLWNFCLPLLLQGVRTCRRYVRKKTAKSLSRLLPARKY